MTDVPDTLNDRIAFMLRLALNRAEEMGERAIEPLGITGRQYGVLAMLQHGPTTTQRELGATLGLDRTTTMKLMAGLEARALVDRVPDPSDRRSYRLSLSREGERLRARASKVLAACDGEFSGALSPVEVRQLRTLLGRLL